LADSTALNKLGDIMPTRSLWKRPATALLLILLLAGLLRLSLLDSKSLWFDEAFSVSFATRTPQQIWQPISVRPETHPPLYYYGLHYWINHFGDSEYMVRLPSALISLINVALIYILGHRLCNQKTGIIAAALLAFSPLNLWYAQEARMYVFMTAILILSAVLLTWDNWWTILPLSAVLSVGLYLDYTMLPLWSLLSAVWVVIWWDRERRARPFFIWFISSITAWILFSPWLASFYDVLESFSTVHLFIRLQEAAGLPFLRPQQYLVVMIAGTVCLIPILAVLGALQKRASSRKWIFAVVLLSFAVATMLFPIPRVFGIKRILVQFWPLTIVWVAWILDQMGSWRRRLTASLLVISLAASLITLITIPKDDWRSAVNYINENREVGEAALFDPFYNATVAGYYDLDLPRIDLGRDSIQEAGATGFWLIAERFPDQLIPSSATEHMLDEQLELTEAVPFYRLEVRRYRAKVQ
jgi:uncharacterized membrane protein